MAPHAPVSSARPHGTGWRPRPATGALATHRHRPATLGLALAPASLILVALLPKALDAQEIRGSAFLETRLFPSSPAFADQ